MRKRGGLTHALVRLDRDRTVVDALPLRPVQFLTTYGRHSDGVQTTQTRRGDGGGRHRGSAARSDTLA